MKIFERSIVSNSYWINVPGSLDVRAYAENAKTKEKFGSEWKSIEVEYLKVNSKGERRFAVDMPSGGLSGLILNEKAKIALESFVLHYGELLPLRCPDEPLWLVNVTNVVDALDFEESDITSRDKYPKSTPLIYRPVFKIEKLTKGALFRLPYENISTTYFDDEFVSLVTNKGLTGLVPRLVWDSEKK